ncbi:hypothetical protein LPJ76_001792 [Coemansia sp. RSA 638]|nr:hypothetical protein LPJ76_001792 [Coemansia sp. RSA 638]
MAYNNIPGHPMLHSGTSQPADNVPSMLQQNMPFGLGQPTQQQLQQHQQQQLQQLQLQLQAQGHSTQQQPQQQAPYTAQQIALARQALMIQQQQQQQQQQNLAFLAQQQQQYSQAVSQNAFSMANSQVASMPGAGPVQAMSAAPGMIGSAENQGQAGVNGSFNGMQPTAAPQPSSASNMAALRAAAAKLGITDSALSHLTPTQLQVFLQNFHAQQMQHARIQGTGVSTPQRQGPLSAESTPAPSMRPSKSVVRERSKSRSPAPGQTPQSATGSGSQLFSPPALNSSQVSPHPLGSPTGLGYSPHIISGTNSIQRKGSTASVMADDMRATPTPSEASASRTGVANEHVYTPEEIANAYKRSEEFLRKLPEFTSDTFVPFLQSFLKENNVSGNFSKPPLFADQSIDLYRFFCEVIRQGGLKQVHARRIWRQVAKDSGLSDVPTLPPLLSRWYKTWLLPLEQTMVFPPGHPTHTGLHADFSIKKRRKAETLGSPGSTPGPGERPYSAHSESSKRAKTHGPMLNGTSSATASPAQATPPYAHSLQSPVQMSRPPPLPLGSSSLSSAALHASTDMARSMSSNSISGPSLPTNGATPTPTQTIPPSSALPSGHMSPAPHTPLSSSVAAASTQGPAVSVVTIPAPPPTQQLRYFPLERSLDTVGGVDLQTSMALRPQPYLPSVSEYGSVDLRALTLSIESGIAMEVTNALNTLIKVTAHPDIVLPLGQCEELAETLFGILENIQLPKHTDKDDAAQTEMPTYSSETSLFGDMCVKYPSEGGIVGDDMQDVTAVRGLLQGGDTLWSFTSDRTLTVVYALRNLSFLPINQQYLAQSSDFAHVFESVVAKCEAAVRRSDQGSEAAVQGSDQRFEAPVSLTVLRALELRKSLVVMLANMADKIDLQTAGKAFLRAILRLVGYFVDEEQSGDIAAEWLSESVTGDGDLAQSVTHARALDGRTYYLHALEAAGRLTASDRNREALVAAVEPEELWPLVRACSTLLTGHQLAVAANRAALQVHASEQRLMWVQMALLVLSNVVSAVTPQPLVASRRYTSLRISPSGAISQQASGSAMRRPMPFLPTVYTTASVPDALRVFRRRLADDTGLIRALLETLQLWWTHIGHACNARGAANAAYDSPLNDLAERAVYVLQRLHPEHDAQFASGWRDWVVERVALGSYAPVLVEVLYELVGLLPVQTVNK